MMGRAAKGEKGDAGGEDHRDGAERVVVWVRAVQGRHRARWEGPRLRGLETHR